MRCNRCHDAMRCSTCGREYPQERECPVHGKKVTRIMKKLKSLALITAMAAALFAGAVSVYGQDAKVAGTLTGTSTAAAPSNDPKDAEIARLKAENAKLTQQVALLKQKNQALLTFYGADDALRNLDAQTPQAPPAH